MVTRRHWQGLVFGIVLIFAGLQSLPLWMPAPQLYENRALAQLPVYPARLSDLARYCDGLDAYLRDHFPARPHLIGGINWLRYALGYSHSEKVIVGQDGWLFYDDGSHLAFHRGLRLSAEQVDRSITGFRERTTQIADLGGRFYAIFPPYKPTIYPENLPSEFLPVTAHSEIDQLLEASRTAGFDTIVDARAALIALKAREPVYTRYDTHWRFAGAYETYRVLMQRIARDFPDIVPLPFDAFPPHRLLPWETRRDLAGMAGIQSFIDLDFAGVDLPAGITAQSNYLTARQDFAAPRIIETNAPNSHVLLIVRDSFGDSLLPFLEANFHKIIYLHTEDRDYVRGNWVRPEILARYRPDIVILEIQELGARFALDPLVP